MKQTSNYKFNVPELPDSPPDITKIGSNFETLDSTIKAVSNTANAKVAKAGDTMTGNLAFSTTVAANRNVNYVYTDLDVTVNPQSASYPKPIQLRDKNSFMFGALQAVQATNGSVQLSLMAYNRDGGSSALIVEHSPNGGGRVVLDATAAPAASSNDRSVATTEFVKTNLNNYLPLAGGTMTGSIYSSGGVVRGIGSDGYVQFMGGNSAGNGARLTIYGKDYNTSEKGKVILVANDGSVSASLSIAPDGTTYAPTPASGDSSSKIATTAFVNSSLNGFLPLAGGTITGTVKAPTPGYSDSSTNVATTAYVKNCVPKSVGNAKRPVYTNANGVVSACTMAAPAVLGLLNSVAQDLSQNGYFQLNNGLILQWGKTTEVSSATTITFPIQFSTVFSVVATPIKNSSGAFNASGNNISISSISNSNFVAGSADTSRGYAGFYWFAVGIASV